MFLLEHFGNGNHKLSSYKSGLGQRCSGYKENLVNRVNPVKKVPPQEAKFN